MCKLSDLFEKILKRANKAWIYLQSHKMLGIVSVAFIVSVLSLVVSKPVFYSQSYVNNEIKNFESEFFAKVDGKIALQENKDRGALTEKELGQVMGIFVKKESEFEKELYAMVGDHPIKEMVPFIAEKDRRVAGFLVGIAKKESNWGKRVPTQNNKDCYNYWGYKGTGTKGSAMGYSCFSSPEEAIVVVGGRLENLVGKNLNTPSRMIVWKCGSSCEGHDPKGVQKWISDVSLYFDKISNKKV